MHQDFVFEEKKTQNTLVAGVKMEKIIYQLSRKKYTEKVKGNMNLYLRYVIYY